MFAGFTPQSIDFLWGIRMNNNRDWFQSHKQDYVQYLYEPMKALGQELFAPFAQSPDMVLKVSRIYRDARMHPPEPYKQSLWLCIRQDVPWWGENPCLFLEMTPEGASYGFFFYHPKTEAMERFRKDIAAQPRAFLELMEKTQRSAQMPVTARCYKRPKAAPLPELEPYYAWRDQISCIRQVPPGPELFDPKLKDQAAELFAGLTPMYQYFTRYSAR